MSFKYFEDLWNMWYTELHNGTAGLTLKIKKVLYSGESPFQRIDVMETYEYGKMLVLYGSIMFTERDEFVYHEMISHVPLFVHPSPEEVLVIGGGDGGTIREVLRHREVRAVTMVEIDSQVVEVSKKFFPTMSVGFSDPRLRLLFKDGAEFVKEDQGSYDVILVDSADPVGPADILFREEFFRSAKERLKQGGIFVAQTESPFYHPDIVKNTYSVLKNLYKNVHMYLAWIPAYPSALWSFCFCSDELHPLRDFKEERVSGSGLEFKYYNPEVHRAAFALPNFVKKLI